MLNAFAILLFHRAVVDAFGSVAGYWYILFQATQFHAMYYASRTLPNTFAFGLSEYTNISSAPRLQLLMMKARYLSATSSSPVLGRL